MTDFFEEQFDDDEIVFSLDKGDECDDDNYPNFTWNGTSWDVIEPYYCSPGYSPSPPGGTGDFEGQIQSGNCCKCGSVCGECAWEFSMILWIWVPFSNDCLAGNGCNQQCTGQPADLGFPGEIRPGCCV